MLIFFIKIKRNNELYILIFQKLMLSKMVRNDIIIEQ